MVQYSIWKTVPFKNNPDLDDVYFVSGHSSAIYLSPFVVNSIKCEAIS